ncbi:LamG-like jellyroll fold domain-containing protein, partial [Bacteroidota bacterium]
PNKDFYVDVSPDGIGLKADKTNGVLNYSKGQAVTGLNMVNSWNHIVAVITPSYSEIYLNGVKIKTINESGSNVGYHYGHASIGVFDDGAQLAAYYKGIIDEIRIYNCALDSAFIMQQYQNEYVSVEESISPDKVRVLRNPTTDYFTISFSEKLSRFNIKLYNTSGNLLLSQEDESVVDIADFLAGVYIVFVYSKEGEFIYSEKVVKF